MTSTTLGAIVISSPAIQAAPPEGINPAEKVGMMASALRLKDQGEYAAALETVSQLREIAPEDPSVNRLYNQLVEEMQAEGIPFELIDTETDDPAPPAPAAPAESEPAATPANGTPETGSQAAIAEASRQADQGNYGEAIATLQRAKAAAEDAATQEQLDNLIASYILEQEAGYDESAIENAKSELARAEELAAEGRYSAAYELIDAALNRLPMNTGTEDLIDDLRNTRKKMLLDQASELANQGNGTAAMAAFQAYQRDPSDVPGIQDQAREVQKIVENPYAYNIREISPGFVENYQRVEDLLVKGRAQFVNGDAEGARQTFAQVETIDPNNVEAKAFLYEIAERSIRSGYIDREKTRAEMLDQVSRGWQQPRVYREEAEEEVGPEEGSPILRKLENIIIPRVTFTGTSLSRAVQSLSEMSEEFDRTAGAGETRGVNMVVTGQGGTDRQVNFSVRNLSLQRILDIVAQQTGFEWDVVNQIVEFRPSDRVGGNTRLQRAIIPISKGTLDLILDLQTAGGGGRGAVADDPFATPTTTAPSGTDDRQNALENFFEASGIDFSGIEGASIVNRGSRLLVNQTSRNIDEIRRTLRELDITDQVEIEAKFMEVAQGNLDELGFEWNVENQGDALVNRTQSTTIDQTRTNNRTLNQNSSGSFSQNISGPPASSSFSDQSSNSFNSANQNNSGFNSTTRTTVDPQFDQFGNPQTQPTRGFRNNQSTLASIFGTPTQSSQGSITTSSINFDTNTGIFSENSSSTPFSVAPGDPARALDLGANIVSNFFTSGVIGNFDLSVVMRAVSRMEGTDLLSAPRVTVMSGKSANIVVAQEFIYPTSYGEPTLTASSGDDDGGGGAVALASGVPEDFETRNLGVELTVTPTVEPNDKINLSLQPRVTEFEGYVSYGGPNIAITAGSSVQSPSGYFQPIFSVRTVETEVTVFDGATVVLGGLTREEVKEFKQKIPVLGDIPFIGRLFRSEGETAQKRNLIIFVTANLISPGGSPAKQSFESVEPNSLFQNPTVISPGGILSRGRENPPQE